MNWNALVQLLARLNARRPWIGHQVGASCAIFPTTRFHGKGVKVASRTRIFGGNRFFGPVDIGSDCFLNRGGYIRSGTSIGNDVAIGPFCRFITDSHEIGPSTHRAGANTSEPIRIGDGAWLGASVIVLPGVTVGAGAVIAAGSVVTKDVPPNVLAGGTPARVIRSLIEPHTQPHSI